MLISRRYRFLFLHIPRTGGMALRYALARADKTAISTANYHLTGAVIKQEIGEDAWGQFYKFAFVRNPWARLVSWYNMRGNPIPMRDFPDFTAFLSRAPIWREQIDWITEHDELIVDFVGRFETLQSDFDRVCERIGVKLNLARMNESRPVDYRDFYTPEARDLVAERYSRDIETFGYQF